MKYISYVRDHYKGPEFPVFRLQDLNAALSVKEISSSYVKRLVNYLTERKEITRITKGVYTFHDDITVAGFAFKPFYYGLENALTIKGLWEQATNPVIITSRSVRSGIRKFGEANYIVRRTDKEMMFGYDLVRHYDLWIPVSDLEKTLIDFVYFRKAIRPDVLKEAKRTIDHDKLIGYLNRCKPSLRLKALKELDVGPITNMMQDNDAAAPN